MQARASPTRLAVGTVTACDGEGHRYVLRFEYDLHARRRVAGDTELDDAASTRSTLTFSHTSNGSPRAMANAVASGAEGRRAETRVD